MTVIDVVVTQKCIYINTWNRNKNARHFADTFFKYILREFQIYQDFFPKAPIDDRSSLDQFMTLHRTGEKPLTLCATRP